MHGRAQSFSYALALGWTVARKQATNEQRREFAVLLTALHEQEVHAIKPMPRSVTSLMNNEKWHKIIPRRLSGTYSCR